MLFSVPLTFTNKISMNILVGMYVGMELMAFWYINIYLSTEPNRLGPHLSLLENKLFSKVIAYNLYFYGYNFSPTGLLAI